MGSTGMHIRSGESTKDAVFSELGSEWEVVAYQAKRTTGQWTMAHYAACKNKETGDVFGLVILSHRINLPNVWENLYFKYVSEDMGPGEAEAPAKVLDALTETTSEYALAWRAQCRENLERAKERAKITSGARLRFANTLNFGDGVQEDTFTLLERSTFRRASDGYRVRIPNWRKRYNFEVLSAA